MTTRSNVLLAFAVLAFGLGGAVVLHLGKDEVETRAPTAAHVTVRYVVAKTAQVPVVVTTHGEIRPHMESTLSAQVGGAIVDVADGLEAGSFVRAGETLLRIDRRDYALRVRSARAEVARARVRLLRERAESDTARAEWAELGRGEEPDPLAARQPQVDEAVAALEAAEAALEQALLDLERTTVRAPFDGRVLDVDVGLGQVLRPGDRLAHLHTTAALDLHLPVSVDELDALLRSDGSGVESLDALWAEVDSGGETWRARIVRSSGRIDRSHRMVQLVARLERPYGADDAPSPSRHALAVGAFADARIHGPTLEGIVLPRAALQIDGRATGDLHDARVALLEDEAPTAASSANGAASETGRADTGRTDRQTASRGTIRLHDVRLVRLQGDLAVVHGLRPGDRVIVSQLDLATDGLSARGLETPGPVVPPVVSKGTGP
ncbi:MAG: efflux RND transporter periplasmic adaptor subunit [Acidobacteriota bacterium]